MKIILADGANRAYSETYLTRGRGGAFIQNERTMVRGYGVSSLFCVVGFRRYTEGDSLSKGARGSSRSDIC